MRVIFDHSVPRKLRRLLKGHYVSIALEVGWTRYEMETCFAQPKTPDSDVIVTADQNLSYQQTSRSDNSHSSF